MSANYTIAVWMSSIVSPCSDGFVLCGLQGRVRQLALGAGAALQDLNTPSEIDFPRENSSILIINDTSAIVTQDGHRGNHKIPPDYHFALLVIAFNVSKTTVLSAQSSK